MSTPLPYKKVLIVGATSGIGRALAEKLLASGTVVIATGRRTANLESLAASHGALTAPLDLADLGALPGFAAATLAAHPDLDGVLLNAGVQRAFDFADAASLDWAAWQAELATNYAGPVRLAMAFLGHLQARARAGRPALLGFTTSALALTPRFRVGGYCAGKAALHAWVMALRGQLDEADGPAARVRVVEILPPAVQTELHDARHQPDLQGDVGRGLGMPLAEFVERVWARLVAGAEDIPVGLPEAAYAEGGFERARRRKTAELNAQFESVRPKHAPGQMM